MYQCFILVCQQCQHKLYNLVKNRYIDIIYTHNIYNTYIRDTIEILLTLLTPSKLHFLRGLSKLLEKNVESYLVREVEKKGGQAFKFNSTKSGMPDRLILMPGGKAYFVEMKAPGEKPRPLQEKRISELRKLGFRVDVIDTVEKIFKFVEEVSP